MKKLFGTDGIRGVANQYPMTAEMAVRVGRALATFFMEKGNPAKIIVGKDTRLSGDMLEAAMIAGICSTGADAWLAGVLPTPGIAHLAASFKANAGIMISASHNPYYDNGIKVFDGEGFKLTDDQETEIEKIILNGVPDVPQKEATKTGTCHRIPEAETDYIAFLKNSVPAGVFSKGLKIILDCSNGATHRVAPQLFADLDTDVESLAVEPNGININDGCGSQQPENLIKAVKASKADVGLAFDGDGDRLIAVDETGVVLTGDHILAICAGDMAQKGTLKNNLVVSTVMSNMGLGSSLKRMGIQHEMTQVGDRYVVERMSATGAVLGGEDSGHMIFADFHTTGDGILTALKLIEAMQSQNQSLSELSRVMKVYPQILMNVDVEAKPRIETVPEIVEAIRSVETQLGDNGRVLVRYSGTQPLCRVMVEGSDEATIRRYCSQISDIVEKKLGPGRKRSREAEKRGA